MDTNETTSVQSQPTAHTSEVRKASFWIAQLCVIIATVLGVFLAANQGFRQALTYGDIQTDKANCYLRQSLRMEMANNVATVKKYVERLRKNESFSARKAPMILQTYVWENMKFSPNTLETPAELLDSNIQFLRDVDANYKALAETGAPLNPCLEALEAQINKLEKDIFPKFDADISEIKARLKKQGIEI